MGRLKRFWDSTIGKKVVMATTGIIGIGFLIAHVAGNLLVFRGAAAFNGYSAFLHGPGAELLWPMRLVLLAALLLHVIAAYQLTRLSQGARPDDYQKRQPQVSTVASRLMRWGGVLLITFIVVHLLHFTTGTLRPAGDFARGDVYASLVGSFRLWWVTLFYLIAVAFLGLHLYHGAWASARTLGATGRSPNPLDRGVSAFIAFAVWFGFTLVPVVVLLGWVR
ncbi:MAG: succinate dehydrogenase cytochrome b subunit [Casimicrobiaceae bacterium]